MKKSELKTNMLVRLKRGDLFLVKTNVFSLTADNYSTDILMGDDNADTWVNLDIYNEDLTCIDSLSPSAKEDFEIVEVYIPAKTAAYRDKGEFDLVNYGIAWRRKKEDPKVIQLRKKIQETEKSLNDMKTLLIKTKCKDDEDIKRLKEALFAKSEERNMV